MSGEPWLVRNSTRARLRVRAGLRRCSGRSVPAALLAISALVGCSGLPQVDRQPQWPVPTHGAVVTEHPLATAVGLEVLEAGGNAADAAVAAALALAVVYPQAGNLGGGGFAIFAPHAAPGQAWALDFRERAPRALSPEHFLDADGEVVPDRSLVGHLAVGVPGSPRGLEELQRRCGTLPWAEVVEPAVRLARDGFAIDAWLARDLRDEQLRGRLLANAESRRLFYPSGQPLEEGDRLRQPELARTLELLAARGAEGFYAGDVARALAAEMRRGGGVLDEQDLAEYDVRWMRPLQGAFRGHRILTMPPPSSGGLLLLQVLAILDGFPLDSERDQVRGETRGAATESKEAERLASGLGERALHWWIEALRFGFADRAEHLGDPDFHEVPVNQLLSADWIAERRTSIGERAGVDVRPYGHPAGAELGETTHLSVIDGEGNAVSLTTTLNSSFGSGVVVAGAGFLLNNQIDDFSIRAGVPNAYGLVGTDANQLAPGKRPLSSMTPTVVLDGDGVVALVLGSPGGPRIISSVIEVLLRVLVYEQDLDDAIRAPRVHQQWNPPQTFVEPGWDDGILRDLEARGHLLERSERRWASVQAIEVQRGGTPRAFSDPRRGGAPGDQLRGVGPAARPGDFR